MMEQGQPAVYLPDDLLEQILLQAPSVSGTIQEIFAQISQQRLAMRDHLGNCGIMRRDSELETTSLSPSVAAIDGGMVVERSLGADAALVVAVGVEGLVPESRRRWSNVQYAHWQRVIVHEGGESSRRFALGVMAALELEILAGAPHDVVILDGSHVTPIIGLNSMLTWASGPLCTLAAELLTAHQTSRNLATVMREPRIVSMVKYDASRELAESVFVDFATPYDDRTLTTVLLEPGEFTTPLPVGQTLRSRRNWGELHIAITSAEFPQRDAVQRELDAALIPAKTQQIFFTYYKPREWSPSYRIELKRDAAESPACLATILQAVKEQVLSPEIREPYPQYLADITAKSVGTGMSALRTAVFQVLSGSGADDYLRLITQSYRTEV